MGDRSFLSIGEVLSLLRDEFPDVTISKIRFLESQGLLDPERTPSGYRKFYDPDVERLRWILRQQRENYLPLKVIKGRLGESAETPPADPAEEASRPEPEPEPQAAAAPPSEPPRPEPERQRAAPSIVIDSPAVNVLSAGESGVTMTLEELCGATGLAIDRVKELERFGLLSGRSVGGTVYYDEEAVVVAKLAAGFEQFGVEARHLRIYKTSAEREAGFFEQIVMPLLKQRNPTARKQALDTLTELAQLGQGLRAAMLRQALKEYTSAN